MNFSEDLDFGQGNIGLPGGGSFGQVFNALDTFHANNNFYGGQLDLARSDYRLGNSFNEGAASVALGSVDQVVNVNGITNAVFSDGTSLVNGVGGTFAQSTNIGRHSHSAFCVVPEGDLKLGYNLTRSIQCFVSCNFLYLSDVARPGVGIDHNINVTQAPFDGGSPKTLVGAPVPAFSFSRTDFWAQGISFGLEIKY